MFFSEVFANYRLYFILISLSLCVFLSPYTLDFLVRKEGFKSKYCNLYLGVWAEAE